MAGKKGMKKYSESIRKEIRQKQENGQSVKSLSKEYGIMPSMSSRGNPYDNAMAENFFSILKTECIYRTKLKSYEEARLLIGECIHFYNHERIQINHNHPSNGWFAQGL